MTQKEKAQRYIEALERARKLHKDAIDMGENIWAKQCEIIFPELAESEEDKIRKDLIEWIDDFPDPIWRCHHKKDVIAWLEKQGEHHIACNEEQLKVLNEVLNFAANHESPYWNDYIFGTLNSLIKQLKL